MSVAITDESSFVRFVLNDETYDFQKGNLQAYAVDGSTDGVVISDYEIVIFTFYNVSEFVTTPENTGQEDLIEKLDFLFASSGGGGGGGFDPTSDTINPTPISNTAITSGNTVNVAFGRTQGQINALTSALSGVILINDYAYTTLSDTATITLNANSRIITNLYLDTTRTATTVSYSNFINGSIVVLKVKKQSASNLTLTVSFASIGIGNTVNNTIILTGSANSYFEIIVEARVVSGTPEYYVKANPF